MPMPLDQWQREITPHLDLIEVGASMCARHVRRLPLRPMRESRAEAEMRRCETVLEAALAKIRAAQAEYRGKTVGT